MNLVSRPNAPGRPKDPEKRAAILAAAQSLFPSKGYDAVSMDAIAQAAGVSKLTLYSHFTDKDTLFGAAVEEFCEHQLPHQAFELHPELSIREALLHIAKGFLELTMDECAIQLFRIMAAQAAQNTKLAEIFFQVGPRRTLKDMEMFLSQRCESGDLEIPVPSKAAEHFFVMLKGVRHMRALVGVSPLPDPEERLAHAEEVVNVFIRAYGKGGRDIGLISNKAPY
jgi:TetR/AcrR family transcriptional regulator, mexJK operon transcriptional repressor